MRQRTKYLLFHSKRKYQGQRRQFLNGLKKESKTNKSKNGRIYAQDPLYVFDNIANKCTLVCSVFPFKINKFANGVQQCDPKLAIGQDRINIIDFIGSLHVIELSYRNQVYQKNPKVPPSSLVTGQESGWTGSESGLIGSTSTDTFLNFFKLF